ncbi:SMP-30/gluconolactonase/LRE family protein [Roseibium album]|uniref:SMP-30/gluconolactonase/LRE family protein n=1 Tax=Roseibium album TaxID=311410 RepID=UPI003BB10369
MQDTVEFRRLLGPVDELPESPCWQSATSQVFWVDHCSKSLRSFGLSESSCRVFDLETDGNLRFVKSQSDSALLVGSERGIYQFDIGTAILAEFGNPPPLSADTCINDGAIGPDGEVVVAISDQNEEMPLGGFYKLSDGTWDCIHDRVIVANGPAFSPCGRMLYLSDTFGRCIFRYEFETGLTERFCDLSDREGYPDGLFATPNGDLLVSYWGGGMVEVLSPDAVLLQRFELAAKNATCCCVFQYSDARYLLVSAAGDKDGSAGVFLRTIDKGGNNG